MNKKNQFGFSMIMLVGLVALVAITALSVMSVLAVSRNEATVLRLLSARDRIWSSVYTMAMMPAAIRNSARATAADGITAENADLRNCLNGTQPNQCRSGVESSLALYSPVVILNAAGSPVGIQRISVAAGSTEFLRYDLNGVPCVPENGNCFFTITSTFVPTCGPGPSPLVMPANPLAPNIFVPEAICTVAETIEVRFVVDVDPDPALRSRHPYLNAIAPKPGMAVQEVKSISGNDPQ